MANGLSSYDITKDMKDFEETKAGVKGLVDTGLTKLPRMFIQPADRLSDLAIKNTEYRVTSFVYKTSKDPRPEYKLFGTIVHSGFSPESGHYYAYIKDAIGRWYCCNDSSVSLSTLQKVLSEKVYILFFSRINQRPALASTASNGVSSHDCNGRETSKILKSALPPKGVQTKPYDVSAVSKVDKVPSSPRMKFNLSGNSISKRASITDNGITVYKNQSLGSNGERSTSTANGKSVYKNQSLKSNEERVPATDNGKIAYKNESCGSNGERTPANDNGKIADNNQLLGTNGERARATDTGKIPYKNQSTGLNGDAKDSVSLEKSEKSLLINRDCLNRDKSPAIVDGNSSHASLLSQVNDVKTETCEGIDTKDRLAARKVPNSSQASLLSRGNGGTGSVKIESCEGIGTKDRLPAGKVPDTSESEKSGLHGRSKVSVSKRKFLDSCILFAPDAQSQAEVEGLKEILKKETSSVLRSCGWLDEVYSFMLSRKKLCSDQVGTTPNSNEVKKLLITDAKSSFLSQIPASLRGDLVKRIQSFSKK
ncbi:ubiquitin carboxyl-terminal hydrolase 25-like [Pyrus ussuriensis x Pyrus communis]|uniref:ubiquitinyl hydrolase 1 n=1 Tax=Pyrus ussuriensis x Pyrus communis TaxID=2448454 RepID=A0A5N5IE72_9ROSA|nr:ubiquitin carboxyl-terminal hydrolase 25-like [Pyrus ussuriensis x Pyrus communis]